MVVYIVGELCHEECLAELSDTVVVVEWKSERKSSRHPDEVYKSAKQGILFTRLNVVQASRITTNN